MTTAEKLQTIAENQHKLYEAGQKSEYDRTWDSAQDFGKRTHYNYGFAGNGWTNETFKPKYDIIPTVATGIFYGSLIKGDLVELLAQCGVVLDFSTCQNSVNMFNSCYYITRVGVIGNANFTGYTACFIYCSALVTIDKIIVNENTTFSQTFQGCGALKNITFEGTIGQNLDIHWSKLLTKASIINIFEHLSSTASGKTLTISNEAVISAFGSTDNEEWKALVASVPNWAVELA